jgi:hypothetical protein
MAIISFTIDNAKLPLLIDTMKWLFPIPLIPDPAWVDPHDGSTAPLIPKYTDSQWTKEAVRRWLVAQVKRKADYDAKTAINIAADDTLIT